MLTVSMVVLAGVLSAGATLWHTLRLSDSYNEALKAELEQKAISAASTVKAFLDAEGGNSIGTMDALLAVDDSQVAPFGGANARFRNEFLSFELWLPDASAPRGYRRIVQRDLGDGVAVPRSEEMTADLLDRAGDPGGVAVIIDEQAEVMHGSLSVSIDERTSLVGLVTISAHDEFAFFANQREAAIRNGIFLSIGIIVCVSLFGAGASVFVSRNLTNRQRAEVALRESEERARRIVETASDAFVSMEAHGKITAWNAQAEFIFGWTRTEAIGRKVVDTIVPQGLREAHLAGLARARKAAVSELVSERKEVSAAHRDGHEFPVEIVMWPVEIEGVRSFNAFVHDISDRKRLEAELSYAATHDALTGLVNRQRFEEELENHLKRAERHGTRGALLFLDLDEFKDVNDGLGHRVGDELLVQLASLLKRGLRDSDFVARLGGDEFGVLLPEADLQRAVAVSEKLLRSLRHRTFQLSKHPVNITGSVGIALFPEHGLTAGELLAHADLAMYQAKAAGRNRVRSYGGDNAQGYHVGRPEPADDVLAESGQQEGVA